MRNTNDAMQTALRLRLALICVIRTGHLVVLAQILCLFCILLKIKLVI